MASSRCGSGANHGLSTSSAPAQPSAALAAQTRRVRPRHSHEPHTPHAPLLPLPTKPPLHPGGGSPSHWHHSRPLRSAHRAGVAALLCSPSLGLCTAEVPSPGQVGGALPRCPPPSASIFSSLVNSPVLAACRRRLRLSPLPLPPSGGRRAYGSALVVLQLESADLRRSIGPATTPLRSPRLLTLSRSALSRRAAQRGQGQSMSCLNEGRGATPGSHSSEVSALPGLHAAHFPPKPTPPLSPQGRHGREQRRRGSLNPHAGVAQPATSGSGRASPPSRPALRLVAAG